MSPDDGPPPLGLKQRWASLGRWQRWTVYAVGVVVVIAIIASVANGGDDSEPTAAESDTPAETATATEEETELAEPPPVALTINDFRIEGGRAVVQGSATLPDGALIAWEMAPAPNLEDATTDPRIEHGILGEGVAPVEGGAFEIRTDAGEWPSIPIEAWVAFQTVLAEEEQPAEVVDAYGEQGENITGPDVVEAGDIRRVEATAEATPGEGPG